MNLLRACPKRSFWSFDASAELPSTLFSDVKSNPSFEKILLERYGTDASALATAASDSTPLAWVGDFVISLLDHDESSSNSHPDSGFGETLAKVMGECLGVLQRDRYNEPLRAAAAKAGFETLGRVVDRSSRFDTAQALALSNVLTVHTTFVAKIAFRPSNRPLPIWADAQQAARDMLAKVFRNDGRDILESMLGLSVIATEERKRQSRARKAAHQGEVVPAPVAVTNLHRASVHKELWTAAYNALLPTDAAGVALFMRTIASFSHVEKLNRNETWSYPGLKLQAVLKEDDFVSAVRAINSGIVVARDPFVQTLETLAMQPDLSIIQAVWEQPGVPLAAMILLLSPSEDVHDPTISLIQASFADIDVRSDAFRALLSRYPAPAMDGLCEFLVSFINTAKITPESCSMAKWLVRCFTDVLDALCQSNEDSEPLLQSTTFLSTYEDGIPMSKRVSLLWNRMTSALAVILKRTIDWAPFYDNDTMVDWMRDALIFGRQMTDNIRAFEAASLGVAGVGARSGEIESPMRPTKTGAKLVQKLEIVLRDLVSWLRLTE